MDNFIRECLGPILSNSLDDEIISYVKGIECVDDFEEFMDNVTDKNNAEHMRNYERLKVKLYGSQRQSNQEKTNHQSSQVQTTSKPHGSFALLSPKDNLQPRSTPNRHIPEEQGDLLNSKGKKKFISINSYDFRAKIKKGRHPCDCQASEHALINNCLKCGRIICEQEGSGKCLTCNTMVCTEEEQNLLESHSKGADKLYNLLMDQKTSKTWKKAVELRDKLVREDKSGEYKNKIFDDQNDYFDKEFEEKEESLGKAQLIIRQGIKSRDELYAALDFASRMSAYKTDFEANKEKILKHVNQHQAFVQAKSLNSSLVEEEKRGFDDFESDTAKQQEQAIRLREKLTSASRQVIPVVNENLLSQYDRGMCLSMHQPWASLLVAGIKVHEGRSWYSEHRGRLWIHAASKEPDSETILAAEQLYRELYDDSELIFPSKYPTSCLLGCVCVDDCMEQDEYKRLFPTGESDCRYVMLCSSPAILPVFFPMKGGDKIYFLGKDIHRHAKEGLKTAKWL